MQTIVIAGGGAGGLELATRLGDSLGRRKRARIVLVDRSPTHFWKPLLHTVASGQRDPHLHQIEYSAQAAEHGFQFVCGEISGVDRASRTLDIAPYHGDDGAEVLPRRRLHYDKLVLALGAVTNFFGVPGAWEHALTLDNVEDAERFRQRFLRSCMQAGARKLAGDPRACIDIVIVGGGATGVELAAELGHAARALAHYNVHALDPRRDVRIRILERGPMLLPHLHPRLCKQAAKLLQTAGVEVCTGTTVARVAADSVEDSNGGRHASDITLWTAGVEGPALCASLGLQLNRLRQVVVSPSLQAIDDPAIFALGDCCSFVSPAGGAAVPPRAQVAHQQAMHLATQLALPGGTPLPPFRYRDYGSLVSLGPFAAIGVLLDRNGHQLQLEGAAARLLYGLMYQKHVLSVQGFVRMAGQSLANWIRAKFAPPVKLH